MSMTHRQLAYQLGKILDATGRLEGQVLAVRDLVIREFGPDHFSPEFIKGFDKSIQQIRDSVGSCYGAIDAGNGAVELEPRDGSGM